MKSTSGILSCMENEILEKLKAQDLKIEAIWQSVEKSRKYFLVTMWITIAAIVLPLLGLLVAIPAFLTSYTSSLDSLLY